jgi:hyperosmotically inducible protein
MKEMKSKVLAGLLLASSLTVSAGAAMAADNAGPNAPTSDVSTKLLHELRSYPYYTIYDDLGFQVSNGQVILTGEVTQPVKKTDVERIARAIPGVTSVEDNIKVLPLSDMDNQLRRQVALAIYRYPVFNKYAYGPFPSIHIIVDNGRVTLTGVVDSQADKDLAGLRASGAGLSFGPVVNNLQVAQPAKKS